MLLEMNSEFPSNFDITYTDATAWTHLFNLDQRFFYLTTTYSPKPIDWFDLGTRFGYLDNQPKPQPCFRAVMLREPFPPNLTGLHMRGK